MRYAARWSLEVTNHDAKGQLGFEEPQGWSKQAVRRTAPMAMLLYSLIVLWFSREGHCHYTPPTRPWYIGKTNASFADMLATACSTCQSVKQEVLSMHLHGQGSRNVVKRLLHVIETRQHKVRKSKLDPDAILTATNPDPRLHLSPFIESRWSMSSQASLFILSEATTNPLPGTKRVTVTGRATATFQVYAGDPTRVQVHHDAELERASYAWGNVAHASVQKGDALLRWIGRAVDDVSPMKLRELHGHFVVVIDDRRRGTISFISDVLGLRPWYVNAFQNRLIAGSDVSALCRAGLTCR